MCSSRFSRQCTEAAATAPVQERRWGEESAGDVDGGGVGVGEVGVCVCVGGGGGGQRDAEGEWEDGRRVLGMLFLIAQGSLTIATGHWKRVRTTT